MGIILKVIVNALAVYATAKLLSPSVYLADLSSALMVSIVLSLINTFIKPILTIITFPLTVMTLGLFSFVINGFIIMSVDYFVAGFTVASFWWALLFSLVLSVVSALLNRLVK